MKYRVIVYGSVFFETDDELLAHACAHNIRVIWKNVTVKGVKL